MLVAFDMPVTICVAVYGTEQAWGGELSGYVGYANGMPVATAAAAITGDAIGLYSVATLPQHRRLGYAEAIMRQVIEQAPQSAAVPPTRLQPTRSGLSPDGKMGSRTLANF